MLALAAMTPAPSRLDGRVAPAPSGHATLSTRSTSMGWLMPTGPRPLAPWARYFISLGERLAFHPAITGTTVTIGFALPVLDRAAVLIATGLVCERAKVPVINEGNQERFERLRTLPVGRPVRVLRKGKLYVGEIADEPEHASAATIPVLFSMDEKKRRKELFLCTARNCMQVEPTQEGSQAKERQRGMRIIDAPEFTLRVLDGPSVESLCLGSRLDYAIVGVRARVLAEANTRVTCASPTRSPEAGDLADVLRLKEGARDFRGMVVSTTVKEPKVPPHPPLVVIYDGANAFLKFCDRFEGCHQVALLDRSEPRFMDAVNELNRLYLRRAGDCPPRLLEGSPDGIDHISFQGN